MLVAQLIELVEVLAVGIRVDRARSRRGPDRLLPQLRARGARSRLRDAAARARLQRVIGVVDRFFPSGGNCYRRALMEIALDAGAAAEPLHLGLQAHGGPGSGHAWLGDRSGDPAPYDAELSL